MGDLRERVFAAADDGAEVGEIAALPRVRRCQMEPKLVRLYEAIIEWVKQNPEATIAELQLRLRQTHQVSASSSLICETLALLGLTRKQGLCAPPSRTARTLPPRGGVAGEQPDLDPAG